MQCTSEQCVVCPCGKTVDCGKMGVVHQLEYMIFNELYVGENGNNIELRIREHLISEKRGNATSPLRRHKIEANDDKSLLLNVHMKVNC